MIKVVNKRTYSGPGEYIGRPSVLGNPFHVSMGREKCIERYEKWLDIQIDENNMEVLNELDRLIQIARHGDLILICWCAPKPCHGDVIKRKIESVLAID